MIDVERLRHDRDYWDSVAPSGAAAFIDKEVFAKWVDGVESQWIDGRWELPEIPWSRSKYWEAGLHEIVERPTRKQWSGPEDGLPPVGTKGATSGGVCDVLAVDEVRDQIAVRWHDGELGVVAVQSFRPLKSEKERVVEAAWEVVDRSGILPSPVSERLFSLIAKRLYDSGFLKMPEEDQ